MAESEITGDSDGEVSAEAKSDGVHYLEVANWPSRQGNIWFIELKRNECSLVLRSPSPNTLLLQKRVNHFSVKVTATRNKYDAPIQLQLEGVNGMKFEGATIAKGKKETTLKITPPADAKPGRLYAFSITGKSEKEALPCHTNQRIAAETIPPNDPIPHRTQSQLHATIIE